MNELRWLHQSGSQWKLEQHRLHESCGMSLHSTSHKVKRVYTRLQNTHCGQPIQQPHLTDTIPYILNNAMLLPDRISLSLSLLSINVSYGTSCPKLTLGQTDAMMCSWHVARSLMLMTCALSDVNLLVLSFMLETQCSGVLYKVPCFVKYPVLFKVTDSWWQ